MEAPPPPPPPPHGEQARGTRSGGLPDGKYDIFVIPPSSSGSGFLYLPSLQTQRNSFLAGCACTAVAFFIYSVAVPAIKNWLYGIMNGGGTGVVMLILGVGVVSWALGKTQGEGTGSSSSSGTNAGGSSHGFTGPPPQAQPRSPPFAGTPRTSAQSPPPKSSWQRPQPGTDGKTAWERAREETRKKEEEKKKAEELKKRREDLEKERQKQRDKEKLERELREKHATEAAKKAKEETDRKKDRSQTSGSPPKRPPNPTARTEREDDEYSFRPYDRPKAAGQKSSSDSVYSEESYAPSASTAKTTPPPSARGPYHT